MKAIVVRDGTARLVPDYPKPVRQPGEALVRVLVAGICNTDLEILSGYMAFSGVLGHEFVGVVEEADTRRARRAARRRRDKLPLRRVLVLPGRARRPLPRADCPRHRRGAMARSPST